MLRANIIRIYLLLFTILISSIFTFTNSQHFVVDTNNTNFFAQGDAFADDFMSVGVDSKTFGIPNYISNIFGYDFFNQHGTSAIDGGCKSWMLAASGIKGNYTTDVEYKWWAAAQPRYFKDDGIGFFAWSSVYASGELNLIIEGTSGETVTVYIRRENYMAGHTSHEAISEDSISSYGILEIENNLFNYFFNDPPGPSGWNKVVLDTSFTATVGDTIHLAFEFDSYASILDPAQYNNGGLSDGSDAVHVGTVKISLVSQPQPPPMADPSAAFYFSLDIGSDTELSDPNGDGDEQFDPGDIYRWRTNILPPIGTFGHHDDAWIFGMDPPPTTILNAAPTMSGFNPDSIANFYFDMDGVDFLDFDLSLELDTFALPFPVPWFPSWCIYTSEFLWISYDDDEAPHYIDPSGSVPVNNISPYMGATYGTTPLQDEVTGINTMPFPPFMYWTYPYSDEKFFHPVLTPNPDFIENDDDDIDALDIMYCDSCLFWYFSSDHEADLGLKPGSIYLYSLGNPPGPIEVINSVNHLGILNNHVDIDAFEFVWLLDTMYSGYYAFALLFSVDDDDPLTVGMNESGGLDPRVIYGSFLNGSHFIYLNPHLPDDIDAITAFEVPDLDTTLLIVPTVIKQDTKPPKEFNLNQNYPNPFNSTTNISFDLPVQSHVTITIYNILGEEIQNLSDDYYFGGRHSIPFSTETLSSGVYLYKIKAKGDNGYTYTKTMKMILIK
ncbi:MAG: T9SS type A sorting domain-containing protein [Ignavibacteriales bacterium]|nr:T9SS type A sorting domain-containing protein [Ignavibacteriales bacterium]